MPRRAGGDAAQGRALPPPLGGRGARFGAVGQLAVGAIHAVRRVGGVQARRSGRRGLTGQAAAEPERHRGALERPGQRQGEVSRLGHARRRGGGPRHLRRGHRHPRGPLLPRPPRARDARPFGGGIRARGEFARGRRARLPSAAQARRAAAPRVAAHAWPGPPRRVAAAAPRAPRAAPRRLRAVGPPGRARRRARDAARARPERQPLRRYPRRPRRLPRPLRGLPERLRPRGRPRRPQGAPRRAHPLPAPQRPRRRGARHVRLHAPTPRSLPPPQQTFRPRARAR
mmetsp:Transcript_18666/g.64248  ORF Transcript_18666/g.64248 Transcript_18666/m.64248 type:complete len:285 (-) Transcript_18666:119-973(-)